MCLAAARNAVVRERNSLVGSRSWRAMASVRALVRALRSFGRASRRRDVLKRETAMLRKIGKDLSSEAYWAEKNDAYATRITTPITNTGC